jgi:hypothetical protein
MKNLAKSIVAFVFVLFTFGLLITDLRFSDAIPVSAQTAPTPAANSAANANAAASNTAAANTAAANTAVANTGDKTIPKQFTLAKDSLSEYGEVAFNHESHAFQQYSEDGKSVVGCTVCHHTDQPKSALKPPLKLSERETALTFDTWKQSTQKVQQCRTCHFQEGNIPDGKTMPVAGTKEINNEIGYHINCNTCHDAAFKLRPDLKKKPGFATTNDCTICHKKN